MLIIVPLSAFSPQAANEAHILSASARARNDLIFFIIKFFHILIFIPLKNERKKAQQDRTKRAYCANIYNI